MKLWSFFRRGPQPELTPEMLRDGLIEAGASGSPRRLLRFCRTYREAIAQNIETLRMVPEHVRDSPWLVHRHMTALIAAGECLAGRLGDSRLLQGLIGDEDTNPILRWRRSIDELPKLLEDLRYDEAESIVRGVLAETAENQGTGPQQYAAITRGRLGEILFHSGRVRESLEELQAALDLCRRIGDVDGVLAYLGNLVQVHRYLGETEQAAARCDELAAEQERLGNDTEAARTRKRAACIRAGEPLNRVVLETDAETFEVDEIAAPPEGRIQFVFERNRPDLQKASVLTRRGCERASRGEHAAALELFQEASEADPYDPDPVFQAGVCLMEMGAWSEARRHFDEVERLAPGWFRCRTDRWLAGQIETGRLPPEVFMVLRGIEDTRLPAPAREQLSRQALERFDAVAPLWLVYGDALRNQGREDEAIRAYRAGLECAEEPDVESRLAAALAGLLPPGSSERRQLLSRALQPDGSLIAHAAARLMSAMDAAQHREPVPF